MAAVTTPTRREALGTRATAGKRVLRSFQVVAAHCTIVKTIKKRKRQWHYNSAELNSSNVKTQSLAFSADLYLRLHGPPTLAGGADYSSRRTSCSRKFRHHVTTESDRTESFRPETPADDSPS